MYTFWQQWLDLVIPPTAEGRLVRTLSQADVQNLYTPHRVAGHVCLGSYQEPRIQALIRENKFQSNRTATRLLSQLLCRYLQSLNTPVCLVPVPLSGQRRRKRGYDQVLNVLKTVPRYCPQPSIQICSGVKRRRNTPPQTSLARDARQENVHDAFVGTRALKKIPSEYSVLLVDDVLTTGATMVAAKEAILAYNPHLRKKLQTVALAH